MFYNLVEQIIGNAVPCALGKFVGVAIEEFSHRKHHNLNDNNPNAVLVFNQYEQPRDDDIRVVEL